MDKSVMNINNTHTDNYSPLLPLSGTTTAASEIDLTPLPYNSFMVESLPQKNISIVNNNVLVPRKHVRDSTINPVSHYINHQHNIDNLISQHMENIRKASMEAEMMKKLNTKEEEIEMIGKVNWALQEKVKWLSCENQFWRELAQTNEATAKALRNHLEHALALSKDGDGDFVNAVTHVAIEDAQSHCDSNEMTDTVTEGAKKRLCRKCRKEESSVLILPCRHLCLCTSCGSTFSPCPICKSSKNVTLNIEMT